MLSSEEVREKMFVARAILKGIRKDYPDAFIAGGYLRDLFCKREPKDLDIFTWQMPKDEDMNYSTSGDSYGEDPRITCVINRPGFVFPTQIIVLDDNTDREAVAVSQFMLGIQQIWIEGGPDGQLVWLPPFIKDIHQERFTVTRCTNEREAYSIARKLTSLEGKYGKPWVRAIPDQFAQYTEILAGNGIIRLSEAPK